LTQAQISAALQTFRPDAAAGCMQAFASSVRVCDTEQCIPFMEALILLMETEINIGYISTRLRIVKTYLAAGHNDSAGTFDNNFIWLRNGVDGRMDEVHILRNTTWPTFSACSPAPAKFADSAPSQVTFPP
jgi:hypothetical protein